jgi:hypothetical protein
LNSDGRQSVAEHALGGVRVTWRVVGSALCVRFREAALAVRRGAACCFAAASPNRPRYFVPGLLRLLYFLEI